MRFQPRVFGGVCVDSGARLFEIPGKESLIARHLVFSLWGIPQSTNRRFNIQ